MNIRNGCDNGLPFRCARSWLEVPQDLRHSFCCVSLRPSSVFVLAVSFSLLLFLKLPQRIEAGKPNQSSSQLETE